MERDILREAKRIAFNHKNKIDREVKNQIGWLNLLFVVTSIIDEQKQPTFEFIPFSERLILFKEGEEE